MRQLSQVRYALDALLAAPSHLAILRALQDTREGMSGRAIARQASVNHQACAVALRKLEALGVVKRQGAGRTQLIRLNFANHLVSDLVLPLLRRERELPATIQHDIANHFGRRVVALSVFGSVGRGEDVAGSDLDLLLVIKGPRKENFVDDVTAYSATFTGKYGIRLSPIVLTTAEVRKNAKRGDPLLKNIVADGIDLLPTTVQSLLR